MEMWNRRCEINFFANVAAVFRHLHPAMKDLEVPQVPAYAEAMRPRAIWFLELLEQGIGQAANSSPATATRSPTSPRWSPSIS